MGGADTEVSGSTTEVLLEAAFFAPERIRATARRHGLHSESSHRFERRVDPARVVAAMNYAARLMVELCGAEAAPGHSEAGAAPAAYQTIPFRLSRATALTGLAYERNWAIGVFVDAAAVLGRASAGVGVGDSDGSGALLAR